MFCSAFKRTRCIVPASGYYEWRPADGGKQQGLLLAGELSVRAGARLLAQRSLQIAFHEAPLGPVYG